MASSSSSETTEFRNFASAFPPLNDTMLVDLRDQQNYDHQALLSQPPPFTPDVIAANAAEVAKHIQRQQREVKKRVQQEQQRQQEVQQQQQVQRQIHQQLQPFPFNPFQGVNLYATNDPAMMYHEQFSPEVMNCFSQPLVLIRL